MAIFPEHVFILFTRHIKMLVSLSPINSWMSGPQMSQCPVRLVHPIPSHLSLSLFRMNSSLYRKARQATAGRFTAHSYRSARNLQPPSLSHTLHIPGMLQACFRNYSFYVFMLKVKKIHTVSILRAQTHFPHKSVLRVICPLRLVRISILC